MFTKLITTVLTVFAILFAAACAGPATADAAPTLAAPTLAPATSVVAADPQADTLLSDLAYVGITAKDPAKMVELARSVCRAFDAGASYWQIMAAGVAGGYTTEQSSKVVAVAAADMCPAYTPVINAALTPAAPARATVVTAAPTQGLGVGEISSGTYLVGSEIAPGRYVTEGADWCYFARLRNLEGGLGAIIANGNPRGHTTISVNAKDTAIEFSGNCTWHKAG